MWALCLGKMLLLVSASGDERAIEGEGDRERKRKIRSEQERVVERCS